MLHTPSAYPEVGSWALFERLGLTHAVRIGALEGEGEGKVATISLADNPSASSGRVTVPLAELLDPTPLTWEERAEMERLGAHLTGLARPERSAKAPRFEALLSRNRHAEQLVVLLEQLERRGLATPATREAKRYFVSGIAAGTMRRAA